MDNSSILLKRNLKPVNVWALALGSIIGWGAFVMPGTTFLPNAGTLGTAIGVLIGAIVMIIIAVNYGYMINRYPVAGGEYTFTEKTYGKKHAFVCAWFLGLSYFCIVPLNATALGLVSRKLLGGVLEFGYLYSIAGYEIYLGEIIFPSLILILFAYLSVKGVKVAGFVQTAMVFGLVASVIMLCLCALLNPDFSISNLKPMFSGKGSAVSGILAVVAVSPWAFVGFDSIPQASEEFDFTPRKSRRLMILSILFGAFVYIAMNTVTASVMPWEKLLENNYDWPTGEAAEAVAGKAGLIFLGVAIVCAVLTGIMGFYMATSRLLFSMAREDSLPAFFGKIDEKCGTPKNAIIFVLVLSLIAPWFGREALGWIVDMSSIGAAIGYTYTSIATYKTLKLTENEHHPVLKVTAILGFILGLVFIGLLIFPFSPTFLSKPSLICLLVWLILGIAFTLFTKHKKKGN
ncbi:MAG: APC family permease [Clostridia bacterium]|nr:APC family permease [Clostridia bacterium]